MHTRTTAGQASIEYITAVSLVAAIFALAGPAVGAPGVAKAVVAKFKVALCFAGADVCSSAQAAREGLAPCPLQTDLTGHEAAVTAFSIEVGAGVTLTITPRSDGTVSVVRSVSGSGGASVGEGGKIGSGPLSAELSADATGRLRVQVARGWEFKDQATADRFLAHAIRNTVDEHDFPAAWHSLEDGDELSASVGAALGHRSGGTHADLIGLAGSAGAALGGRVTRDGTVTLYTRATVHGETDWPILPTVGLGRADFIIEYTFNRTGLRELAFREAMPSRRGNRLTETTARLDLRDPENLAAARQLLDAALPWPPGLIAQARRVGERIRTHGTIETSTSEVDDSTTGVSASGADGVRFGVAYTRIKVHRTLVSATARTGGPFVRRRFDCLPQG